MYRIYVTGGGLTKTYFPQLFKTIFEAIDSVPLFASDHYGYHDALEVRDEETGRVVEIFDARTGKRF